MRTRPMIVLSTAHPAKFPEAIERAHRPTARSSPSGLRLSLGRHERFAMLPNDSAAIASFIATMRA